MEGSFYMKRSKQLLALLLCAVFLFACAAPAFAAQAGIRNVILLIGDGMGYNHLKLAEEQGYEIFMDDAPDLFGWSRTRSASSSVTDSAAGATALSCGVRTNNGMLGIFPEEAKREAGQPRSLTENAILHGMKTGIVTTDQTNGATPAGFSAHTLSRDNTAEIIDQQLKSRIDLIWGAKQSKANLINVSSAGFTYLSTRDQMLALSPGSRSYGQFADDLWKAQLPETDPSLAQMSEKAISLLSQDNESGFFLMIEGAHIDKKADDSKDGLTDYPEKIVETSMAVKTFDDTVRTAADFARRDGHTLVIITADHETGDLFFDENTGRMTFHASSHTAANVPVFVYGANDLFENGAEMDNYEIPNLIAAKLGWSERFPVTDPVGFLAEPPQPQKELSFFEKVQAFFDNLIQWIRACFERVFRK